MKNKIWTKIIGLSLCTLMSILMIFNFAGCAEREYSSQLYAMNTVVDLSFYGSDGQKIVSGELNRLESLFSVTRKDSDISRINFADGKSVQVSADTESVLRSAQNIYSQSHGLYDPSIYPLLKLWGFTTGEYSVPADVAIKDALDKVDFSKVKVENDTVTAPKGTELDLGGIGKGYAGDKCREKLKENGITSAILSIGGNVCTVGMKPDGSKWTVALKNPNGGEYLCSVNIGECSIVTSGGYERNFEKDGKVYHHIIDPRTGRPAESGLKSATVICADGAAADALSTAIFIGGEALAEEILETRSDVNLILYTEEDELLVSSGIEDDLVLNGAVKEDKVKVIDKPR